MILAGIEVEGTYTIMFTENSFVLLNKDGKVFYSQTEEGEWAKREYNNKGKLVYFENSRGFKENIIDE